MKKPDSTRLVGKRVVLRDWRLLDLGPWEAWLKPKHRWHDLYSPYYPRPSARYIREQRGRLSRSIAAANWPAVRQQLVIAERASDVLIGLVTWGWESRETHWPLVGVVIYDDKRWGQGIGTEALGLWTDYLFTHLTSAVRLDLRTWSGNPGMMRLAEKLGYKLEARFRKARIVGGKYYDGLGYGLLREEWRSAESDR